MMIYSKYANKIQATKMTNNSFSHNLDSFVFYFILLPDLNNVIDTCNDLRGGIKCEVFKFPPLQKVSKG